MRGIFLLSVLGLVSVTEAGLSLDLYYESLCPDSTRFISQQIGPMHEALGQDVTINFVPYGFASVGIKVKGVNWSKEVNKDLSTASYPDPDRIWNFNI